MLVEDLPEGSPERKNAQEILMAGKRGSELVKQILSFSRQQEHQLTPVRVETVLKEAVKLCHSIIPANIEVRENIQMHCGFVMADSTQMHQVAMNLITNAFHAVKEKNGRIDIEFKGVTLKENELPGSVLQPGQYVKLSVSDNGIGMTPGTVNKIFEPYFTTKAKGKGTGLGLAVVYGIIMEHRGDLRVYSVVDQGSTFDIYLPLMKKATESVSVNPMSELQTGSEKILLVDDEESVVRLEKQMLERLGYEVTEHTSSVEALETFESSPEAFDLVVSDMAMPKMTGDQLAKPLFSIREGIPIIICTGFSEKINKEQAENLGVKGFLMKPVLKTEMATMVRNVLDEAMKANPR